MTAYDPEDQPRFNPSVRRGRGQYNEKRGRFETWEEILRRYDLKKQGKWKEPPLPPPPSPACDPEDEPLFNPVHLRGRGAFNRKTGQFETWDVIIDRYQRKQSAEAQRRYAERLVNKSVPALWQAVLQGALDAALSYFQKGEYMNDKLKAALVRLGRAMAYGAIATGVQFLAGHTVEFVPSAAFVPLATAVLMAIDKFVRESLKPQLYPDEE